MSVLSRESILQAADVKKELVNVPEWGGEVYVRSLTSAERDRYEKSLIINPGGKAQGINLDNARAKLAALTICDENGVRLFTEKDVTELGQKSAAALQRIWTVAQRLSAVTEEDMEDLTKNSESGQPEDSSSG